MLLKEGEDDSQDLAWKQIQKCFVQVITAFYKAEFEVLG